MAENLSKDPIRVIRENSGPEGSLDSTSRINYSRVYTVENWVRVMNIGIVHKDSIASLQRNSLIYQGGPLEKPQKRRDKDRYRSSLRKDKIENANRS